MPHTDAFFVSDDVPVLEQLCILESQCTQDDGDKPKYSTEFTVKLRWAEQAGTCLSGPAPLSPFRRELVTEIAIDINITPATPDYFRNGSLPFFGRVFV